jgi:hypothetical protein
MSDWEDSYDIGGDGVPDDFDSVADFDDGVDVGADVDVDGVEFGTFDEGADLGDLGGSLTDADAWIVDLDIGGLADIADIAVVAGPGDDVGSADGEDDRPDGAIDVGAPLDPPLLAHDLAEVPDGADPFAALVGRPLDDAALRNEVRHLRLRSPFGPTPDPVEETVESS